MGRRYRAYIRWYFIYTQVPEASAGSLQGWTVGRGHDWGMNRRIPDAKLCTSESSSNSSVGRGPETWHAPIVHQIPKAGSVSCPLFTNAPRGSSYTKTTAAGEIDFGSNFIGPTLTRLAAADPLVLLSGTHAGCFA